MPCLQITLAGMLPARSPGSGLFTKAWGLKVNVKGLFPWPCFRHFLGPWHIGRGPDSTLIHEHIGCVFPQPFIADIMGVMVALVFMVSTQQTFVRNENLKKTTLSTVSYSHGATFWIALPLPVPNRYTFEKGRTLVFFCPIRSSSQPYEIIPIPFLLLF